MDDSYRFLAARYVRRQAKQLLEQFDGVRQAEDIEFVHRARVASRRLRAALGMFRDCFGDRQGKKWRKQLRRLTRDLGEARDKDVQIELLCAVLGNLTDRACMAGISRLLVKLEHDRERRQPRVVRAVDAIQQSGVLEQMQAMMKEEVAGAKALEVSLQSEFTFAETERHILRGLDDLLSYQDCLGCGEDIQRHHAMRIAAKRLRYTAEIAKPVYQGRLDEIIEAIKKVQTLLGDVHDCDVWMADLERFARQERKRTRKYFGHVGPFGRLEAGIECLRQDRRTHRSRVFRDLVNYWRQLQQQGVWEEFVQIVRARDVQPVAAVRDAKPESAVPRPTSAAQEPNGRGRRDGLASSSLPTRSC